MSYPWIGQSREMQTFLKTLQACAASRQPVVLVGNPGEGKTAMILALGKTMNRPVIYLSMSSIQSEDMTGLPYVVDLADAGTEGDLEDMSDGVSVIEQNGKDPIKVTRYAMNDWQRVLIDHPTAILFCDELNTASPSTMKTFLPIFQTRIFPNRQRFSDDVFIVGAVNPDTQSGGFALSLALRNRIAWIPFTMSFSDYSKGLIARWESEKPMPVPKLDIPDKETRHAREVKIATAIVDHLKHQYSGVFSEFSMGARGTDKVPASYGIASSDLVGTYVFNQTIASGRSWDNLVRILACFDESLFDATDNAMNDMLETIVHGVAGYVMGDTLIRYLHDSYKSLIDIEDFLDANKIKKIEWKSVNQTQMLPLFDAMYKKAENGDIKAIFTSLIWLKKKGYTGLLQSADVTAMYNATYFKKALEKGRIKNNDESKALRKEFLDVFSEELNHAKTI